MLDVPTDTFSKNQHTYRSWLFTDGLEVIENKAPNEQGKVKRKGMSEANVDKVIKLGGKLSRHELLLSKVKYFSDGIVIGSQSFITVQRRRFLTSKGLAQDDVDNQLQRGRRKDELSEDMLVTWQW